jgi:hypothetical protein
MNSAPCPGLFPSVLGDPRGFRLRSARFLTCLALTWLLSTAVPFGSGCGAPITWERVYYDPVPTTVDDWGLSGVSYGNGLFVAVGIDIAVSSDGRAWNRLSRPSRTLLLNVAYGAGRFVAVGGAISLAPTGQDLDPSAIVVSEDGLEWRTVLQENLESAEEDATGSRRFVLTDVVWAVDRFVAVGFGAGTMLLTSTNGIHWNNVSSAIQPYCESITYGQGTFVVIGNQVRTSPDSLNWNPVLDFPGPDYDFLGAVRYGKGWFVMTAVAPGRVFTSRDGSNWSVAWQEPGVGWPHGIAFGRESYVCVGGTDNQRPFVLAAGKDMVWEPQDVSSLVSAPTTPSPLALSDVVYGEGHFVAVGMAHLILLGTELSTPPALSEPQINSEGPVEFFLSTSPGDRYWVEISEDLMTWAPLAEGTSNSPSVRILDSTGSHDRARFYRAMIE